MNKRDLKEYRIWKAMKARCYAPSNKNRGLYQQKGIKVCDRWLHDFNAFMSDMGSIPGEDYSIERIDPEKDYCPENCKWIPMKDQAKNRTNVPKYTYQGETHCLKEWSKILGFNLDCVRGRIRRGMSFDKAISEDVYHRQIQINGKLKTVKEWCDEFGLKPGSVYSRIHRGMSPAEALTINQDTIKVNNGIVPVLKALEEH